MPQQGNQNTDLRFNATLEDNVSPKVDAIVAKMQKLGASKHEIKMVIKAHDEASMKAKDIRKQMDQIPKEKHIKVVLDHAEAYKHMDRLKEVAHKPIEYSMQMRNNFAEESAQVKAHFANMKANIANEISTMPVLSTLGRGATNVVNTGTGAIGLPGLIGAGGLAAAATQSIQQNVQQEQDIQSLRSTLKDQSKAREEISGINRFARTTPFNQPEVLQADIQMRQMNIQPHGPVGMKQAANLAAGTGQGLDRSMLAIVDATRRGDFRVARGMGLNIDAQDFQPGGRFTGMSVEQGVGKLINQRFGGAMQLQAQTWQGRMSNIQDVANMQMIRPMGTTAFSIGRAALEKTNTSLTGNNPEALNTQRKLGEVVENVNKAIARLYVMVQRGETVFKTYMLQPLKEIGKAIGDIAQQFANTFGGTLVSAVKYLAEAFTMVLKPLSQLINHHPMLIKMFALMKAFQMLGADKMADPFERFFHSINPLTFSLRGLIGSMTSIVGLGPRLLAVFTIKNIMDMKSGTDSLNDAFKKFGDHGSSALDRLHAKLSLISGTMGTSAGKMKGLAAEVAGVLPHDTRAREAMPFVSAVTKKIANAEQAGFTGPTRELAFAEIKRQEAFTPGRATQAVDDVLKSIRSVSETLGITLNKAAKEVAASLVLFRDQLAGRKGPIGLNTYGGAVAAQMAGGIHGDQLTARMIQGKSPLGEMQNTDDLVKRILETSEMPSSKLMGILQKRTGLNIEDITSFRGGMHPAADTFMDENAARRREGQKALYNRQTQQLFKDVPGGDKITLPTAKSQYLKFGADLRGDLGSASGVSDEIQRQEKVLQRVNKEVQVASKVFAGLQEQQKRLTFQQEELSNATANYQHDHVVPLQRQMAKLGEITAVYQQKHIVPLQRSMEDLSDTMATFQQKHLVPIQRAIEDLGNKTAIYQHEKVVPLQRAMEDWAQKMLKVSRALEDVSFKVGKAQYNMQKYTESMLTGDQALQDQTHSLDMYSKQLQYLRLQNQGMMADITKTNFTDTFKQVIKPVASFSLARMSEIIDRRQQMLALQNDLRTIDGKAAGDWRYEIGKAGRTGRQAIEDDPNTKLTHIRDSARIITAGEKATRTLTDEQHKQTLHTRALQDAMYDANKGMRTYEDRQYTLSQKMYHANVQTRKYADQQYNLQHAMHAATVGMRPYQDEQYNLERKMYKATVTGYAFEDAQDTLRRTTHDLNRELYKQQLVMDELTDLPDVVRNQIKSLREELEKYSVGQNMSQLKKYITALHDAGILSDNLYKDLMKSLKDPHKAKADAVVGFWKKALAEIKADFIGMFTGATWVKIYDAVKHGINSITKQLGLPGFIGTVGGVAIAGTAAAIGLNMVRVGATQALVRGAFALPGLRRLGRAKVTGPSWGPKSLRGKTFRLKGGILEAADARKGSLFRPFRFARGLLGGQLGYMAGSAIAGPIGGLLGGLAGGAVGTGMGSATVAAYKGLRGTGKLGKNLKTAVHSFGERVKKFGTRVGNFGKNVQTHGTTEKKLADTARKGAGTATKMAGAARKWGSGVTKSIAGAIKNRNLLEVLWKGITSGFMNVVVKFGEGVVAMGVAIKAMSLTSILGGLGAGGALGRVKGLGGKLKGLFAGGAGVSAIRGGLQGSAYSLSRAGGAGRLAALGAQGAELAGGLGVLTKAAGVAAKRFLPITALFAGISAFTAGGGAGNRAIAALDSVTMGLLPLSTNADKAEKRFKTLRKEFIKYNADENTAGLKRVGGELRNLASKGKSWTKVVPGGRKALLAMAKTAENSATRIKNAHIFDAMAGQLMGMRKVTQKTTKNMLTQLKALPPGMRRRAIDSMVAMADQLEKSGQLPKGSARRLRKILMKQFDGMKKQAERKALNVVAGLAEGFAKGEKPLKVAMDNITNIIQGSFGGKAPKHASAFTGPGGINRLMGVWALGAGKNVEAGDRLGTRTATRFYRAARGGGAQYTRKEIKAFQRRHRLKADGILGPRTRRVLNRVGSIAMQSGGLVPGAGDGDSIRALLEPGEFVLRKKAVRKIGQARLQALNQGIRNESHSPDWKDNRKFELEDREMRMKFDKVEERDGTRQQRKLREDLVDHLKKHRNYKNDWNEKMRRENLDDQKLHLEDGLTHFKKVEDQYTLYYKREKDDTLTWHKDLRKITVDQLEKHNTHFEKGLGKIHTTIGGFYSDTKKTLRAIDALAGPDKPKDDKDDKKAHGGVVGSKETLGKGQRIIVGEEGHPEVIIPLAPHRRDRAMSLVKQTQGHLAMKQFANGGTALPEFKAGGFTGPHGSLAGMTPVANLARRKFGLQVTAGRTDHTTKTAGGRTSDHSWGGALDLSNSTHPTKEMGAWFHFARTKLRRVIKQLIYKHSGVNAGGVPWNYNGSDHFNHVHTAMLPQYAKDPDRMAKILHKAMEGVSIEDLLIGGEGDGMAHMDLNKTQKALLKAAGIKWRGDGQLPYPKLDKVPKSLKGMGQIGRAMKHVLESKRKQWTQGLHNKVDAVNASMSTGGGGDVAVGSGPRTKEIWKYFKGHGLSDAATAGIMGNMQIESGFRTNAPESGFQGLVQWDNSRWGRLVGQAKKAGRSPFSLQAQLDYIWYELTHSERAALNALRGAKGAREAGSIWDRVFERSAGTSRGKRMSAAAAWYNKYHGKHFANGGFAIRPGGLAGGISNVPRDNFPALLHQGEGVLTQRQNQVLKNSQKLVARGGNKNFEKVVAALGHMRQELIKSIRQMRDSGAPKSKIDKAVKLLDGIYTEQKKIRNLSEAATRGALAKSIRGAASGVNPRRFIKGLQRAAGSGDRAGMQQISDEVQGEQAKLNMVGRKVNRSRYKTAARRSTAAKKKLDAYKKKAKKGGISKAEKAKIARLTKKYKNARSDKRRLYKIRNWSADDVGAGYQRSIDKIAALKKSPVIKKARKRIATRTAKIAQYRRGGVTREEKLKIKSLQSKVRVDKAVIKKAQKGMKSAQADKKLFGNAWKAISKKYTKDAQKRGVSNLIIGQVSKNARSPLKNLNTDRALDQWGRVRTDEQAPVNFSAVAKGIPQRKAKKKTAKPKSGHAVAARRAASTAKPAARRAAVAAAKPKVVAKPKPKPQVNINAKSETLLNGILTEMKALAKKPAGDVHVNNQVQGAATVKTQVVRKPKRTR